MRHYKNIYINVGNEDQIERALTARGEECATITEAKEKARRCGGFAVRAYLDDGGAVVALRIFY